MRMFFGMILWVIGASLAGIVGASLPDGAKFLLLIAVASIMLGGVLFVTAKEFGPRVHD